MKKQWILSMAAVLAFAGMATAQEATAAQQKQATVAKQIQELDDDQLVKFLSTQSGDQWSEIMNAIFPAAANDVKLKVISGGEKALNAMGENAQAIADNVNANVPAVTVSKENGKWTIAAKEGAGETAGKEVEDGKKEEGAGAGEADTTVREEMLDLIDIANEIEKDVQTDRPASGPATKK